MPAPALQLGPPPSAVCSTLALVVDPPFRPTCQPTADRDNPLPDFIDPITMSAVVRPAISPYGYVAGLATWKVRACVPSAVPAFPFAPFAQPLSGGRAQRGAGGAGGGGGGGGLSVPGDRKHRFLASLAHCS